MQLGSIQKHIKLVLLIVLVIAGLGVSIFAGSKASNLFFNSAKAQSCPAFNIKSSQVTANSSVVSWETQDKTIGKIEYGSESKNLAFSALEKTSEKTHSLPLTLLTPNTKYYYLIEIGNKVCDASGQTCVRTKAKQNESTCVPFSFSTTQVAPQGEIVAPIVSVTPILSAVPVSSSSATVTKSASPSAGKVTPTITKPAGPSPTSGFSAFCKQVSLNIGETSSDSARWATVKQYDIDNNGIINGKDVIRCPATGK